jgi:hypothetical protein
MVPASRHYELVDDVREEGADYVSRRIAEVQ